MQGSPVAFDLRTMIDGPSVWGRILIFYLLALSIAAAVAAVRIWRQLSLGSARTINKLQAAVEKLRAGDKASLVALARNFREWEPEAGLRAWSELTAADTREAFQSVVRQADRLFRFRSEDVLIALSSLRRGLVFAVELTTFVVAVDIRRLLEDVSKKNALPFFAWGMYEVLALVAAGAFFALAAYAVYWHFSIRLARRRNHWQDFVSRALGE